MTNTERELLLKVAEILTLELAAEGRWVDAREIDGRRRAVVKERAYLTEHVRRLAEKTL